MGLEMALYRPNIDHKSSLKSAYLHVLRHNPTSQEIHVKQGAGRYFHISSFNGRVIHFPEIYHISNNRENLSPF